MPPADGRAPRQRRRVAPQVPSIAPAVPPRRRSTPWCSIISRPSSPRRRTPTPWAGASPGGWGRQAADVVQASTNSLVPGFMGTRGQVKSGVSAARQRPSGRGLVSEGVLLEKLAREGGKEALAERVVVGGVPAR
jgi:hypothetical protein